MFAIRPDREYTFNYNFGDEKSADYYCGDNKEISFSLTFRFPFVEDEEVTDPDTLPEVKFKSMCKLVRCSICKQEGFTDLQGNQLPLVDEVSKQVNPTIQKAIFQSIVELDDSKFFHAVVSAYRGVLGN